MTLTGRDLPARSLADPSLDLVDLGGSELPDLVQLDGYARRWRNLGNARNNYQQALNILDELRHPAAGQVVVGPAADPLRWAR